MADSISSWLRTRLVPLMSVALLGSVALVFVGYLVEKFSGSSSEQRAPQRVKVRSLTHTHTLTLLTRRVLSAL
jgi:hypothetical protein